MSEKRNPTILCVDDEKEILDLLERMIATEGYRVLRANSGKAALVLLEETVPDLILLDVMMPGMTGLEVCARIQENKEISYVPVVFLTALEDEQDKARAFVAGAIDYLTKPIKKDVLLSTIRKHLRTKDRWSVLRDVPARDSCDFVPSFMDFKEFLSSILSLSAERQNRLTGTRASDIYTVAPDIDITSRVMAKMIAGFLKLQYLPFIDPGSVRLGVLPAPFCKENLIVPLADPAGTQVFVISNPFDLELIDLIKKQLRIADPIRLFVTEPESIISLLDQGSDARKIIIDMERRGTGGSALPGASTTPELAVETHPVIYLTNNILHTAVAERASDIHFEPKEESMIVRFRVDGDMKDICNLTREAGIMSVSRFKVLGGLDLAEKKKPLDGAFEATIGDRRFRLRLTTTSTLYGESLIIRLLEPHAKPRDLSRLGMTNEQAETMRSLASRSHGLALVVGPTGSGKTTTIYSLLASIDSQSRSLISVEDPIEYVIPHANQQQVSEKRGLTFENLLKSSVRQDPDILFIGEIRDQSSARMAVDFASTGHLTISTLHTTNATTAIFRLERLGIGRTIMADSILCVVAQRLLKRLCPHCKRVEPISQQEIDLLSPFSSHLPSEVAHPVGCLICDNTGYLGREGVYEVLRFDPEITEMVRSGKPISEIRRFSWERGNWLVSHHALQKVEKLTISPNEAYERVLVEEMSFQRQPSPESVIGEGTSRTQSILVVDDDEDIRRLVTLILENRGYQVTSAGDGSTALSYLKSDKYDLIISDVRMPNMDGFKLLEIIQQSAIDTPVILLTSLAEEESEVRGLALGAVDYIRKPVQKDILLLRVNKILKKHPVH